MSDGKIVHVVGTGTIGEPLIGKQLLYNGLMNRFKIIEKLKDPDCWTCSYKKPQN